MEEANKRKSHIGFLLMEIQFKILKIEKLLIKSYSVLLQRAMLPLDKIKKPKRVYSLPVSLIDVCLRDKILCLPKYFHV